MRSNRPTAPAAADSSPPFPAAAADFIRKSDYKPFGTWGSFASATEHAANVLGVPGLSFETSYQRAHGKLLEPKDYREIGRLTADAVADGVGEMKINRA